MRCQPGKALAGAGFDIGTANQLINQRGRIVGADLADHAFGIAAGGDLLIRDLPRQHDLQHLREMMQLFFDQQHHLVRQILAVGRAVLRQDLAGEIVLLEQGFRHALRFMQKRFIRP
ncbi:hypothetical protein D3C76_1368740 [compost metagenome]